VTQVFINFISVKFAVRFVKKRCDLGSTQGSSGGISLFCQRKSLMFNLVVIEFLCGTVNVLAKLALLSVLLTLKKVE